MRFHPTNAQVVSVLRRVRQDTPHGPFICHRLKAVRYYSTVAWAEGTAAWVLDKVIRARLGRHPTYGDWLADNHPEHFSRYSWYGFPGESTAETSRNFWLDALIAEFSDAPMRDKAVP